MVCIGAGTDTSFFREEFQLSGRVGSGKAQSLFQRELIFMDEDFDLLQNRIYRCVSDRKKTAGFIISRPASHSIGTYGDMLHRDTTFSGLHDTGGRASGSVNPAGQIDEAALTGKRKIGRAHV